MKLDELRKLFKSEKSSNRVTYFHTNENYDVDEGYTDEYVNWLEEKVLHDINLRENKILRLTETKIYPRVTVATLSDKEKIIDYARYINTHIIPEIEPEVILMRKLIEHLENSDDIKQIQELSNISEYCYKILNKNY